MKNKKPKIFKYDGKLLSDSKHYEPINISGRLLCEIDLIKAVQPGITHFLRYVPGAINHMMLKSVSKQVTPQMDRPSRTATKTRTTIFTGNLTRASPNRINIASARDICIKATF